MSTTGWVGVFGASSQPRAQGCTVCRGRPLLLLLLLVKKTPSYCTAVLLLFSYLFRWWARRNVITQQQSRLNESPIMKNFKCTYNMAIAVPPLFWFADDGTHTAVYHGTRTTGDALFGSQSTPPTNQQPNTHTHTHTRRRKN